MSTKKTFKIILLIILILVICVVAFEIRGYYFEKKLSKCPEINNILGNYYGDGIEFIDCQGIISIESWSSEYAIAPYVFRDFKHNDTIGGIKKLNEYKILDDYLYFIDYSNHEGSFGGSVDEKVDFYFEDIFMDGKLQELHYGNIEEIPKYRKVNTTTGEVVLYKTLNEMPESGRKIFEELERIK